MIIPLLLATAITFTPQRPTVGDPIVVNLPPAVTVQPGEGYEIVARRGNSVIVRTFEPKTFALHTSDGEVMIPVHSVLAPDDKLEPAPLVPPRAERYPMMPFLAIALAAWIALLAWTFVFILARRRVAPPAIAIDPAEGIRRARDWAELADAVRRFLAATDPRLGLELTTRELLASSDDPTVAEVLRQGDLQKFSPWGAAPGDFDALRTRALALIPPEEKAA